MGVYIKGVTVEKLVKALICSTELMPDGFEIVQASDVGDMVSRSYILAEYDRQHEGLAGKARKIIEEAPSVEPEIIRCKDCMYYSRPRVNNSAWCSECRMAVNADDYCSRAKRRTDE